MEILKPRGESKKEEPGVGPEEAEKKELEERIMKELEERIREELGKLR